MKQLKKPDLKVNDILADCASSYRNNTSNNIKERIIHSINAITLESNNYDKEAQKGNWSFAISNGFTKIELSKDDMCNIYDYKFVKANKIKNKYYDKLISLATNGICPICGIGQVSTLDHYLAKTNYPIYSVTPYNLIPVCKDCNFEKGDSIFSSANAPFHPYYDNLDSIVWLKATIIKTDDHLIAKYSICDDIQKRNPNLYTRLVNHINIYKLDKAYSIQATTEIAENYQFWKEKLNLWGEDEFKKHLNEILESKEKYQINTWKTALLRALIDNPAVILN